MVIKFGEEKMGEKRRERREKGEGGGEKKEKGG